MYQRIVGLLENTTFEVQGTSNSFTPDNKIETFFGAEQFETLEWQNI